MLSLFVVVGLLCWGSDGAVSCKNEDNQDVNWYILYKAPKLKEHKGSTGLEYIYIDSTGMRVMVQSTNNYKSIIHPTGVLANTLRPIMTPIRSMVKITVVIPTHFGFLSYSDQPPGCTTSLKFGHSKGVVMLERGGNGVWLSHSTPQFPFRRDIDNFFPPSGARNAQTFICVTLPYSQFSHIGKHLQYIGAFPFEHDFPDDFPQELKDAAIWKRSSPSNNFQKLISTDMNQPFHSIAKQQSDQAIAPCNKLLMLIWGNERTLLFTPDGDLYVTISTLLNSDLAVQTWGCQKDRSFSDCVSGTHNVYNVKDLNIPLVRWGPKKDHSKWCVSEDQNKPWICIADVNRAPTQFARPGGALCMQNIAVHQWFKGFCLEKEKCQNSNIMDISDCEPDTDTYMDPPQMG